MKSKNSPSRTELLPVLLKALNSEDPDERYQALSELADWEKVPDAAIDPLLAILSIESDDARAEALRALTTTESPRLIEPCLELLEELKEGTRNWVRNPVFHAAVTALGRCGMGDPRVVKVLSEHITSLPEMERKTSSFEALKAMGPKAKEAVPALQALIEKGEEWERTYAHATLYAIDEKLDAHLPAIIAALGSKAKGESVQGVALLALLSIGKPALAALDEASKGRTKGAKHAKELAEMIRARG